MEAQMNASAACRDVAERFCFLADAADAAGVAALFDEAGVFERGTLHIEGRDGIAGMVQGRPAGMTTRHMLTTSVIDVTGSATARGRHYCLVFAAGGPHDPSRPTVREYRDEYVMREDGWKIAHRLVLTPFEG